MLGEVIWSFAVMSVSLILTKTSSQITSQIHICCSLFLALGLQTSVATQLQDSQNCQIFNMKLAFSSTKEIVKSLK